MEYFSIGAVIISLISLILTRVDKAKQNGKEDNQLLIKWRLDKIDESLQKINDKLDKYDTETDEKIEKAINNHIAIYHSRKRKSD